MIGKRTTLQALALIAIGSLLGYAAATSERSRTAAAAPPAGDPGPVGASDGRGADGSGRGTRLALAERNQAVSSAAARDGRKPNILVIFGDDIGQSDISAYTFGLMGYRTPNIDRIAKEGLMFTDYYAEQSCTAGRSSFITG
jgi:Sulfatase